MEGTCIRVELENRHSTVGYLARKNQQHLILNVGDEPVSPLFALHPLTKFVRP